MDLNSAIKNRILQLLHEHDMSIYKLCHAAIQHQKYSIRKKPKSQNYHDQANLRWSRHDARRIF